MTNLTNCPDCQEVLSPGARKCRCGWKYKSLPPSQEEIDRFNIHQAEIARLSLGELYNKAKEDIKAIKKEHPEDWQKIIRENANLTIKKLITPVNKKREAMKQFYKEACKPKPEYDCMQLSDDELKRQQQQFINSTGR